MSGFINFSRAKRGSTQTNSSSPSLISRNSFQSQLDGGRHYFFRMRSIRSTMTPEKLLQCFRDEYRPRIQLRSLVPSPLSEPQTVPELSAVASVALSDTEHIDASMLSSNVLIDDDFIGFTNLFEPSETAAVDVVAVSAVGSHPYRSWSAITRSGPEMWLQDYLPPRVPRARILVYGHDTKHVDSQPDAISTLAANFVRDLREMRQKTRINQRPLMLIAHSTGCLVLKQALCGMPDLVEQELVKCTVFLGAPHDGLDRAAIDILLDSERFSSLPRELSAGSQAVLDLNSAFAPVADRLHIVAFFELLKTSPPTRDGPSDLRRSSSSVMVVPSESATLFRSVEHLVECDHLELTQAGSGNGVICSEIISELQAVVTDVIKPAGWKIQQRGPVSPMSQGSESDYFPESPTTPMKSWQPKGYESSARSRTKSIPTPFRRRSSSHAIPQQLVLHYAVRSNDAEEARRVLETFTELDVKDPARDNRTALHEAAAIGNVEVAKALLDAGAVVEPRTRSSFRTPLHFAARAGHEEMVKLLLDRSSKINTRSADQSTPLIHAVEKGHKHIVSVLLGRDANVHFERDRGVTALELSERFGHEDITRMLKNRGARINLDKPNFAPEYPGLF